MYHRRTTGETTQEDGRIEIGNGCDCAIDLSPGLNDVIGRKVMRMARAGDEVCMTDGLEVYICDGPPPGGDFGDVLMNESSNIMYNCMLTEDGI